MCIKKWIFFTCKPVSFLYLNYPCILHDDRLQLKNANLICHVTDETKVLIKGRPFLLLQLIKHCFILT